VSDEFTVPVCRGHHREIHRCGDEAAWWERHKIDLNKGATFNAVLRPLGHLGKCFGDSPIFFSQSTVADDLRAAPPGGICCRCMCRSNYKDVMNRHTCFCALGRSKGFKFQLIPRRSQQFFALLMERDHLPVHAGNFCQCEFDLPMAARRNLSLVYKIDRA
jgi:hypothetical protein